MRRTTLIALIFVTLLSSCSTYNTPNGRRMADPQFCRQDGEAVCLLAIGAAVIGAGIAIAN